MPLNESIAADAALEWFVELGYAGKRLNVSIPEGALATVKESLSVPESGEWRL